MKRLLVGCACLLACVASAEDGYIQSDGTQYIDTGYRPTPKTKVIADYAFTATTPVQQRVYGVSGGSTGLTVNHYINGGGHYAWAFQNNDGNWYNSDVDVTTARRRFTLDGPGNVAVLETWQEGGTWTKAREDMAITTARTQNGLYSIVLFANRSNGNIENYGKLKLYGLQIYEDGVLVRDYVPCRSGNQGLLKEAVSGIYHLPAVGNDFVPGGDAEAVPTRTFVWTGADGTDWCTLANWSVDGAAATQVPFDGDVARIDTGAAGSTTTISCKGSLQLPFSALEVTGAGTLVLTDVPGGLVVETLSVAEGARLSMAPDATFCVNAATVAGVSLASARYTAGTVDWIASGTLSVNYTHSEIVDNELILEIASGSTVTYNTQLAATLRKVVKLGPGTAVITNDANATFTGVTEVRGGVLEVRSNQHGIIPTLGNKKENTITVFDGAQIHVFAPSPSGQGNKRFNNQFYIAGYGPDGTGALRYTRTWLTGGQYNCDSMYSDVTLTGDALITSTGARFGLGGGTVDMGGHTLELYPKGTGAFMVNGGTWKNGHIRADDTMNPVVQNANTFSGGADNTFTLGSKVVLGFWVSAFNFDWTLIAKGDSAISLGAGTSDTVNNLAGPIRITDGTLYLRTYTTTAGMRQHLSGKISGAGNLQKEHNSFVFLDNAENDWTGGLTLNGATSGGLVAKYPGSVPAASAVKLSAGVLAYDPANWQGSDVKTLAERATYAGNATEGGFIAPYLQSGATATLSTAFEKPVQIGAFNAGIFNFAGRLADGSVLRNVGGTLNVTGDNDGVVMGGLHLRNGVTTFGGTGYINLTNNYCTIGSVNNQSLCRVTVKDGATLGRFVPSGGGGTSEIFLQDGGSKGAVLEILAGGAVTNKIQVGADSGYSGALYVDGGTAYMLSRESNDGILSRDGYGFTGVYAGNYDIVGWLGIGAGTDGVGVFEQTGGSTRLLKAGFCPSRGGTARVRFSGGTFQSSGDYIRMGEQQWGVKEATGKTSVLTVDGTANVSAQWLAIIERTNAFTSVVNLNGGVFSGICIRKSDWNSMKRTAAAKAYVGFNGGTFRPTQSAANNGFYSIFGWEVSTCDCVRVYAKGATFDTNGKNVSNGKVSLAAPTGKGVSKITLPAGVPLTGHIGAPMIEITGDGAGATAWCTFDHKTGTLGEIIVTSPGWNYTTATATIRLSDRSTNIVCAVELADSVTTGGLTVKGGGNFRIYGVDNTYGGETFVTNATLSLEHDNAIPTASPVRLCAGTLDLNGKSQSVPSIGGSGLVKGGTLTVTEALKFDAATAQDKTTNLVFTATVDLPAGIVITDVENLDESKPSGVLCTFAQPLTQVPAVNVPSPWRAFLSDGGKTLKFGYQHATMLIIR